MSNRKEYEMLFQLNAQMGGAYNSTFKSAQGSITSMQKEIEALSRTQSDISSFQRQQSAIEATKKKLDTLQQQYDNIQREMSETGEFSSELANKLLSKQQQIEKTTASLDQQTQKLGKMGAALQAAGVNTDDLTKETAQLGSQIDEIKVKQQEAADKAQGFGVTASQAFGVVQQAIIAAGIAKALQEIYEYFLSCADASMDFETAMTGVAKTTNFTNDEFAAISSEIKAMSTDIPATTDELSAIAETAGQLGIQKGALLDFTEIMAMLGTATNMTADEAATMLAQFASITGMNPDEYSNLGSVIVDLGNNFATTERNIAEMSQTIAAAGAISGMSEADITAIAAAVTSLGISSQNGGTQMTKLISDINSAVSSGEGLDAWAGAAHMSAENFAEAWGEDAAGALDLFIQGLNSTYESGGDVYGVLTDLGITETRMVTAVTSLAKAGTRLTDTLDVANFAWTENSALMTEAEKRYATAQSQLTMMQNAYNNLKIAVGDNYTPALEELYTIGTKLMGEMTKFIESNPGLVQAITAFVGVVGAVVAALTAYAVVAKLAAAATALLTATIPGVNVIMAVTVGIAAVTAGIVALSSATNTEEKEVKALTSTSREQYHKMRELETEYNEVSASMGATSYEAQLLKRQLDEATASFEDNKQTAAELAAEQQELADSHAALVAAYDETISGLDTEYKSTGNLINKLDELMGVEGKTAGTKQQILTLVEMLNEAMPELGLAYNEYADSLNMSTSALHSLIEVEIAQEKYQANREQLKKLIAEETVQYDSWQEAVREAAAAESELQKAQTASAEVQKGLGTPVGDAGGRAYAAQLTPYLTAVNQASMVYEKANAKQRELQSVYDDNIAQQEELTEAMVGYTDSSENATDATSVLNSAIFGVTSEIQSLTTAYNEAYAAAFESISGQYELWDKAAEVVATDAGTMNSALESQITYWEDYNTNLGKLTERSAEIDGLSQMLSSFADGSSDSVNAIAGMAGASDEKLAEMVENWKTLQKEQETVSESLADLTTDFSTSMDALQKELEGAIEDIDMNDEAAQSGKDTIQGFIDGANVMIPAVQDAYSKIAKAAVAAIDEQLQINSPSKVLWNRGEYAIGGFVGGVEAMQPEVTAAMKDAASVGTEAFSAEEAQFVALAPQFMAYMSSYGASQNAVSAESNPGTGGNITLTIAPTYEITGISNPSEIESTLREHDSDLRDMVLQIMESAGVDATRRSYR